MWDNYQTDIDAVIARRYDNGADLWATPDKKIAKGSPFSTLDSVIILTELDSNLAILKEAGELLISAWRNDGRFKIAPTGSLYPCQTANVARALCRLGYAEDSRLEKTFSYFLDTQYKDGGWRCNTYKYGRGPETEFSNPGPTLAVLDAFRFTRHFDREKRLDNAVESLLDHWVTRKPLGPCRYGIGSLFMQIEYPFFRYNLFFYVYVLSFYKKAQRDHRFLEALELLESKQIDGQIVVENPNRKLAGFTFCKKGEPSALATKRYREILGNLGR